MSEQIVWSILNRNLFFIKDAVKASEAKMSDKFDIFDPESRAVVLECREPDISGLVKLARLFGGGHDHGTPFNLVAKHPGSGQQAFRVARGSTSFSFGGVKMEFRDHRDDLIGNMKKEVFALGLKFSFNKDKGPALFVLQLKTELLSKNVEILLGDKSVARIERKWTGERGDLFEQGKFAYALSVAPEVPPNNPVRQLLVAFSTVIHRVNA
ncbi:MAG: hypothetical protein ABMA26_20635 [Limisphaerales bacterium]